LHEAVEQYLIGKPFKYGHKIGDWCVDRIDDLSYLFQGKASFNEDISKWNVASVKNMNGMFESTMFNGNLSKWNVASVENMMQMFNDNTAFKGDISNWNVAAVKDMRGMFQRTT
jgi:surface protein